ncbi:hypothetical protein B4168_0348 [Anoxybacillus flavithermus]|nr:hypothetical protein B4168_0348 [Anoxybacillus flavithermus]OAO83760.1 hypothetical protein GT23_4070 [Parageobacillus thermoglucosidasius]
MVSHRHSAIVLLQKMKLVLWKEWRHILRKTWNKGDCFGWN